MTTTKARPRRRTRSTNGVAAPAPTPDQRPASELDSPQQRYLRQLARFEAVVKQGHEDLLRASERAFGSKHRAIRDNRRLLTAEYQLFDGGVLFDPAESEADERDADLFSHRTHPLGTVEMHSWQGVYAEGDVTTIADNRLKDDERHERFLNSNIKLTVARGVSGCPDLFLEVDAAGMLFEWASSSADPLKFQAWTTPEALVALATILPRVVEMARRNGLLEEEVRHA